MRTQQQESLSLSTRSQQDPDAVVRPQFVPPRQRSASRTTGVVLVAVLVPLLLAAGVYFGSGTLKPTYQSSASFRVTVPNQQGLNDTVVSASNELATQYAQFASATPVVSAAAKEIGIRPEQLAGRVSASTVNAQNLVQVTVQAGSGAEAQRRANAIAEALRRYVDHINADQTTRYASNVSKGLEPLNAEISRYQRQLRSASESEKQTVSLLLGSLLSQRQQVLSQLAQNTAANRPNLQGISAAGEPEQVRPRPALYAAVTLLLASIISVRLAFLALRRRSRG